ncbi:MAG: TonB-dependent receptor plug domain-containing protein, partial [bacterium]|nr:TonB-dependent receptor plug domain-containing protein [bacterium]
MNNIKTTLFSIFLISLILFLNPLLLPGQEKDDIIDISLDELLNTEITVASKKATTLRESPGIVTLITEKEIKNSGARDLIDVLRLVPGFTFGVDVQNTVGVAMRGNWAHEGKILLIVDGQEFNELAFASLQFGNHFPLHHIKRIEIIRGPGSAMYGGYAELGVIKITTKQAEELDGVSISGTYGQMKDAYGRRNFSLSMGKKSGDLSLTASVFSGQANRSDSDFSDFYEDTFNMAGNEMLKPLYLNLGLQFKELNIRFIMDQYRTTERDIFYVNAPGAIDTYFDSYFLEIGYDVKFSEKITLSPKFNYKKQKPYYTGWANVRELEASDPESYGGIYTDDVLERITGNMTLSYDVSENINIITGVEAYKDSAKADFAPSFNGQYIVNYSNISLFGQGLFETKLGNLTIGARYEDHSEFGSSFVPRFALTKIINKFHFKALYSKAFRAPSIHNISDFCSTRGEENASIKPENTTVLELEAGYQLSKKMFITANLFDIKVKDPIVYYYDEGDKYDNYEKTGTRGFELEIKWKDKWGYAALNYSFYRVNENLVDQYEIEGEDDLLLGMPAHKIAFNSSFKVMKNFRINPSLVYI